MAPVSGCRPAQLKIAVDDVDAAIAFYQRAFGSHYEVTRRTEEADCSSFIFSKYGENDTQAVALLAALFSGWGIDAPVRTRSGHRSALPSVGGGSAANSSAGIGEYVR
jgi:hypothetical protein